MHLATQLSAKSSKESTQGITKKTKSLFVFVFDFLGGFDRVECGARQTNMLQRIVRPEHQIASVKQEVRIFVIPEEREVDRYACDQRRFPAKPVIRLRPTVPPGPSEALRKLRSKGEIQKNGTQHKRQVCHIPIGVKKQARKNQPDFSGAHQASMIQPKVNAQGDRQVSQNKLP